MRERSRGDYKRLVTKPIFGRRIPAWPTPFVIIVILLSLATSAYFLWQNKAQWDDTITAAVLTANRVTEHIEQVDTEADFPDRRIKVSGSYLIDAPEGRFAAYSTTTLLIPDMEPQTFSLQNIALPNEVFTRITTESPGLKGTIPEGPDWRRFPTNAIPPQFANISIAGPILNNLRIFENEGAYLELMASDGLQQREDELLLHYVFKLSDKALADNADGTLGALIDRIGEEGRIDVWVDEASSTVRYLQFSNPTYRSTTTLRYLAPLSIEPPLLLSE